MEDIENPKLQSIVRALANDHNKETEEKAYFAESELNLSDIVVEVEEFGAIELPLTKNSIERLIDVSSKAKFGWRDQTIVDENVRNTHEIIAEKLRVTIEPSSMTRLLNKIRQDLNLDEKGDLSCHLHNMLIYSRGQFFDMHQDTEKMANMIATLVVVLPSAHIGGDLVIRHKDDQHVFSTENIDEFGVKCIAFYADCMHKVEKVKHGYRVALTYNLVLNFTQSLSDEINKELYNAMKEYFCDENSKKPQKLVYILNHEYSEHGLKLPLLKGSDRVNVSSLLNVAKMLCLVPHLALVEIKQTFSTEDEGRDRFYRRKSGRYYDDSDDDDGENVAIIEFLESEITLTDWVDTSNRKVNNGKLEVSDNEICWTRSNSSIKPYNTEYEGYQGNYGCTKDFWYRRAAVVLWPESRHTMMHFMLNHKTAFDEVVDLTRNPGNEDIVIDTICKAGKYFCNGIVSDSDKYIALGKLVQYVQDKKAAAEMLSPFSWSMVNISTAEILANLQNQYGVDWLQGVLETWRLKSGSCNLHNIEEFLQIFLRSNGALSIAEKLLEEQSIFEESRGLYWGSQRSNGGFEKLRQLFKACENLQSIPILHKFIRRVSESPQYFPFEDFVDFFLKLKKQISPGFYLHFGPLKTYLLNAVNRELELKKDYEKDWSLTVSNRDRVACNCTHCSEALRFLTSKTERIKNWKIAAKFRNHVTSKLNRMNLPIDISVDKYGVPHRLVIIKNERMFNDTKERIKKLKNWQEALNLHKFDTTKVEVKTEVEMKTEGEVATEIEIETEGEVATEVEIKTEGEVATEVEIKTEGEIATEVEIETEGEVEPEVEIKRENDAKVEDEDIMEVEVKKEEIKIEVIEIE